MLILRRIIHDKLWPKNNENQAPKDALKHRLWPRLYDTEKWKNERQTPERVCHQDTLVYVAETTPQTAEAQNYRNSFCDHWRLVLSFPRQRCRGPSWPDRDACSSSLPLLLLHPSLLLLPPTHPSFSLIFPFGWCITIYHRSFWFLHPSASATYGLRLQRVGHKTWLCSFLFKISFSNNKVCKLSQSFTGP